MNGVIQPVSGKRIGKHVPTPTNTGETVEERCREGTARTVRGVSQLCRVEAGSNTSTVARRVVGGDKKGSLESETVKIWPRVPRDSDPRMTGRGSQGS
jgi:hypothetical protein